MKSKNIFFLILLIITRNAFSYTIKSNKIIYDIKNDNIQTIGNTEITKDNKIINTKNSSISLKNKNLSSNDIEIWINKNKYIKSKKIYQENNIIKAEDSLYTTCYGCEKINAWEITSSKFVHNPNIKYMEFYNPILWIYKIPVFWSPYLTIPNQNIKYKSGILIPTIKSTNNMGTQIDIPIYLNFSNKHDSTLTISHLTDENPLFNIEHRLNGEYFNHTSKISFTNNKENLNKWHILSNNTIELGENAKTEINIARTSDKTYLQKYGFYKDEPYLDSNLRLDLFNEKGYMIIDNHIFQDLRNTNQIYNNGHIIPNIYGLYQTNNFFKNTFSVFNFNILNIKDSDNSSKRISGKIDIISPWIFYNGNKITFNISLREDFYYFDNIKMHNNSLYSGIKTRFLPSAYIDWSLPLIKQSTNWNYILEPNIRINVMKITNDSIFALHNDSSGIFLSDLTLFSDDRFNGLDLWENSNFIDYGFKVLGFNSKNNIEFFTGQSIDLTKQTIEDINSGFHEYLSDYVGRINYSYKNKFSIYNKFRLSKYNFSFKHLESITKFKNKLMNINLGYIFTTKLKDISNRNSYIEELSLGTEIFLTEKINLFFDSIYNIEKEIFQRHKGGIYYNHPCYYLSLSYKRDNSEKDDFIGTTTFQFKFGLKLQ